MKSYKIPKELKSELKLNKFLYITDLAIILILIAIRVLLSDLVQSSFSLLFTILFIALGIFLIIRPSNNPQKRMYQAIYLAFIRRKETYSSIDEEGD